MVAHGQRPNWLHPDHPADQTPEGVSQAAREQDSACVVSACRFLRNCPTYSDKLIAHSVKGQTGLGCVGQSDDYRKEHCRAFACKLLAHVLTRLQSSRS